MKRAFVAVAALAAAACQQPTPVASISISPDTAELAPKAMQKFSATVSNTDQKDLVWSVIGGIGTIDADGNFTASDAEGQGQVQVALKADPTVTAQAQLTIKYMGPRIVISPDKARIKAGTTFGFTAQVSGLSDESIEWSVVEMNGGEIDAAGLYTAPESLGTFTVRATSAVDASVFGESKITIVENLPLAIAPALITIRAGQSVKFAAISTDSSVGDVRWELKEAAAPGNLAQDGTYTASATTGGVFTVRAISKSNPEIIATASLEVYYPPIRISGTVAYSGRAAGSGPIAVTNYNTQTSAAGVNVRGPGAWAIEGFQNQYLDAEDYFWAFIDAKGGSNTNARDNAFTMFSIDRSKLDQTSIELSDYAYPAMYDKTAAITNVDTSGDTVALSWLAALDGEYFEVGDGYRVYWSRTPNPSATNKDGAMDVVASEYGQYYTVAVAGLTVGTPYYFTVATLSGTTEFAWSSTSTPVTVGTGAAGTKQLHGTLQLGSLPKMGKLYVFARQASLSPDFLPSVDSYRFVALGTPAAAAVPFTFTNLEAGKEYLITYLWDLNGDGRFTFGTDRRSSYAELATVQSDALPASLTLNLVDAPVGITTRQTVVSDQGQKMYRVDVLFHPGTKQLFNLTRRAAPDQNFAQSTWPSLAGNYWYKDGKPSSSIFTVGTNAAMLLYGTAPFVSGTKYTYDLEFVDGSTDVKEVTMPAPLEVNQLEPLSGAPASPIFKWAALPASTQATQLLEVGDDTGAHWSYQVPAGTTEVAYNLDGTATKPALTEGHAATWSLTTTTANGDVIKSSWTFPVINLSK